MPDAPWQRELRARQVRWRQSQRLPIGQHDGRPLGSRLAMPEAENQLWNFLTPAIGKLVRSEYRANLLRPRREQKMYRHPRLFEDLLSSQPMAFNLFGELALDLELATAVARQLWPDRIERVEQIEFEWSPGRWDRRYLDNGTAADVAIFHTTPGGGRGAIFVETKYHEDLSGDPYALKPRYFEVSHASGAFVSGAESTLAAGMLQQLWFDHLLALATQQTDGLDTVLFVVMYPELNEVCAEASVRYRAALDARPAPTFEARILEDVTLAAAAVAAPEWLAQFRTRYLGPRSK